MSNKNEILSNENKPISLFDWANLFTKVYGDNGKIAIAYWIASMYNPYIREALGGFPILSISGDKGTGKTQLANSIGLLNGFNKPPFSLYSRSTLDLSNYLQEFDGEIALIDEYNNSINHHQIEILKNAFDGVGLVEIDPKSRKFVEPKKVQCGIILTGLEPPTAYYGLYSRVIPLITTKNEFTDDERKNFNALKNIESKGLIHLHGLMKDNWMFLENGFENIYDEVINDFEKKFPGDNYIPSRLIRSLASVLSAFYIFSSDKNFPFTYDELKEIAFEIVSNQLINKK